MLRPFALVSIALVTLSPTARAVPKSAVSDYKAAVKLENEGKLTEALAAFEALPESKRDFDVRLHIGSCLRKLGRLKDAKAVYVAIVSDPAADQPTRDTASSDLDDLESRFPKLKVRATAETRDVVITIDGTVVVPPATETVDPGERVVVATRAGKTVFERKVFATEGAVIDVLVDAPLYAAAPPAPRDAGTSTTPALEARTPLSRSLGFVAVGVGVVGIGAGTAFLLRSDGLRSESEELAARGDSAAFERTDAARSAQLLARVCFGVGVAAAATGAVLLIVSRREGTSTPATALRLGPSFISFEGAW